MENPIKFKSGEYIKDVYSEKVYKVIEPHVRGLAQLLNTETGRKETWNACNNERFIKQLNQLTLF